MISFTHLTLSHTDTVFCICCLMSFLLLHSYTDAKVNWALTSVHRLHLVAISFVGNHPSRIQKLFGFLFFCRDGVLYLPTKTTRNRP